MKKKCREILFISIMTHKDIDIISKGTSRCKGLTKRLEKEIKNLNVKNKVKVIQPFSESLLRES